MSDAIAQALRVLAAARAVREAKAACDAATAVATKTMGAWRSHIDSGSVPWWSQTAPAHISMCDALVAQGTAKLALDAALAAYEALAFEADLTPAVAVLEAAHGVLVSDEAVLAARDRRSDCRGRQSTARPAALRDLSAERAECNATDDALHDAVRKVPAAERTLLAAVRGAR